LIYKSNLVKKKIKTTYKGNYSAGKTIFFFKKMVKQFIIANGISAKS